MEIGALDMLCIIPSDDIEKYGIPFLCICISVFKKEADDETCKKWIFSGNILRGSGSLLWEVGMPSTITPSAGVIQAMQLKEQSLGLCTFSYTAFSSYNHFSSLFRRKSHAQSATLDDIC